MRPALRAKHAEEIELLARQLDRRIAEAHFVAGEIDGERRRRRSSPARRVRPCAPPVRSERADPRQQFGDAERLDDVVVGAGIERGDLLDLRLPHRKDQDRHARPFADAPDDLLAVEIRQAEVEDDEIGRVGGGVGRRPDCPSPPR